jgi:hypothetical protein
MPSVGAFERGRVRLAALAPSSAAACGSLLVPAAFLVPLQLLVVLDAGGSSLRPFRVRLTRGWCAFSAVVDAGEGGRGFVLFERHLERKLELPQLVSFLQPVFPLAATPRRCQWRVAWPMIPPSSGVCSFIASCARLA